MNSLKNWYRIHRNIDFVKKFRQNLSLAVLIALVLIKKKACTTIRLLHNRLEYQLSQIRSRNPRLKFLIKKAFSPCPYHWNLVWTLFWTFKTTIMQVKWQLVINSAMVLINVAHCRNFSHCVSCKDIDCHTIWNRAMI